MPLAEYLCMNCKLLRTQRVTAMSEAPEALKCAKCASMVPRKGLPTQLGVGREGTNSSTLDHAIGADAAKRWDYYGQRIEEREQVRAETGSPSLSQTDAGYVPLSPEQQAIRKAAYSALDRETPPPAGS